MRRFLCVSSLAAVLSIAAGTMVSSFQGAPSGVPVGFTLVPLPPVSIGVAVVPSPGLSAIPQPFSPWTPSLNQLLTGNTVITTEAQMRDAWRRLFKAPFQPGLFDFDNDFVVLMGGGPQVSSTFEITAVERVDATYSDPLGGLRDTDPFLSVTSTLVLPGIIQDPPPPAEFLVSAARISKTSFDDVVFHGSVLASP